MRVTAMPPSATVLAASTSRASPPSGPPSLRPNERRAKEPVATVPRGAEPQVAVVEGRTKVLRWRELKLCPVGRGQESLDLRLVLLGQQRAGGVNQSAAWTDEPCGALQHVRLHGQQLFYGTRPAQPAGVWVAPPGADAGARRVDEHPVEAASGRGGGWRRGGGERVGGATGSATRAVDGALWEARGGCLTSASVA